MFSHVMIGSNDIEKSKLFYDAILSVLGYPEGVIDSKGRCLYINKEGVLGITRPINGESATYGNGMTVGFKVTSPELVDAWHAAGLASGGIACEDPPGIRASAERKLYLAYLRDPTGNKICATHYMSMDN
ncbi:TPA: VOC family protein [Vibrio vulnificus]|nr:VOC family protein [Vibrio vulnificus]MCU8335186.1 VOC family protein [Vibrio vulnificus]MCU8413234.1 VOC family protein [Vibrio vulnificus]HAS8115833.1 VOC family protein [Vibrio vulnificus]HAS8210146.1 VOC family protein [Vibrio vulnificus]